MVKIEIYRIIKGGLDHEDGSILYHALKSGLKKKEEIVIDFLNIDFMTSSFLNTSFRILAKEFDHSDIRKHIKIINSNSLINKMIKESIESETVT